MNFGVQVRKDEALHLSEAVDSVERSDHACRVTMSISMNG